MPISKRRKGRRPYVERACGECGSTVDVHRERCPDADGHGFHYFCPACLASFRADVAERDDYNAQVSLSRGAP